MEPEKRLLRPHDGIMIGGVCAGFARYFGIDVTIVRLIWVFILLVTLGTGTLAYLICWVVIPQEDAV